MKKITSENDLIVGEWYWVNCDLEYPWSAMHVVSEGFAYHVWAAFGNNPIYHCPTPDTASQDIERLREARQILNDAGNSDYQECILEAINILDQVLTPNSEPSKGEPNED